MGNFLKSGWLSQELNFQKKTLKSYRLRQSWRRISLIMRTSKRCRKSHCENTIIKRFSRSYDSLKKKVQAKNYSSARNETSFWMDIYLFSITRREVKEKKNCFMLRLKIGFLSNWYWYTHAKVMYICWNVFLEAILNTLACLLTEQ